jgi:hypothetical protein
MVASERASGWCKLAVLMLVTVMAGITGRASISQANGDVSHAERLELFRQAYHDVIERIDATHVIMGDGQKFVIDDKITKTHQKRLAAADIKDMLSQIYPTVACMRITDKPVRNFDPGRIRNGAFMKAAFGASEKSVRDALVAVPWFGRTLKATRRLGVSVALERVGKDLAKINGLDMRFVRSMGGTFKWRLIAGTKRLSVHSFGAAIDLNTKYADYWRWSGGKPGKVPKYVNRVPENIVATFEKHGFIWGGRWYHYDTMHFEYRPAIMAIARLAEKRGCSAVADIE